MKPGRLLVVDKADKAVTHITYIMKNLVENCEITSTNGRKLRYMHALYQTIIKDSATAPFRNYSPGLSLDYVSQN